MKKFIACLFLVSTATCFGQKNFMKGYYIDNTGNKIECLIKNSDWSYNPKSFQIKLTPEDTPKEISLLQAKEFAIDDNSKYVRETVAIDNSKGEPLYSYSKEPNFIKSTLFLKVLIDGKNTLYRYENDEFPERFFYKSNSNEIKQLISKKYFNDSQTELYLNEQFKRQLMVDVRCDSKNLKIESLTYNEGDLMDYFKMVNTCQGDVSSKETSKRRKSDVYYKLVLNTNFSFLDLKLNSGLFGGIPFNGSNTTEKKLGFGFGFEFELVLPFNNKGWSVFTEPTYNSYTGNGTITSTKYINPNYSTGVTNRDYDIELKYNYIQIPIGIKKNIYFNNSGKLNIQTALNLEISNNSTFINGPINGNRFNFFIGAGYEFNKIGVELRKFSNINLNQYQNSNNYSFKNICLSLKYRLN